MSLSLCLIFNVFDASIVLVFHYKRKDMIYLWSVPNGCPERYFAEFSYDKSPDPFQYMHGERAELPDRPMLFDVKVSAEELRRYDVLGASVGLHVVSPKIRKIFDEVCPDSVQYIDTEVRCLDRKVISYKALNVTQLYEVLDIEKSSVEYYKKDLFDGQDVISRVNQVAFLPRGLGPHHIVRMAEYKMMVLVSETIYRLFKEQGATGMSLETAEEYNEAMRNIFKRV